MRKLISLILVLVLVLSIGTIGAFAADKTPKAVVSNGSITFYYDDVDHSNEGDVFDVSDSENVNEPDWQGKKFKTAIFDDTFKQFEPKSTAYWFLYGRYLETVVHPENLNTSNVVRMDGMFAECSALKNLDLTAWDVSNVKSMANIFGGCEGLESLNVSTWNTKNVESLSIAFEGCSSLKTLDVSKWNTEKVSNMGFTFNNCINLAQIDLSNWNTKSLTTAVHAFAQCESLTTMNLSNWNTSKLESTVNMFSGCKNLSTVDLSNWDMTSVESMRGMFEGCNNLQSVNVSGWDTSNVDEMEATFKSCKNLTSLDLSSWDTSNVSNMKGMFANDESLKTVYVSSKWSTEYILDSQEMFAGCSSLKGSNGTMYDAAHTDATYAVIDTDTTPGYLSDAAHLKHVLTKVEAKSPTCTADGNTQYYICKECNKYYSDAAGLNEITINDTIKKATGHQYGEWSITKAATETSEGEKERTCSVCGEKETQKIDKLSPSKTVFSDVPVSGTWYSGAVYYAADKGYMDGTGNGKFSPEGTVTRGTIAQILYAAEGKPEVSGKSQFTDVGEAKWYAKAVKWAADKGLVSGYGNGKFGPEDNITREQMVAIMLQYSKMKGYDTSTNADLSKFRDQNQISNWAVNAVKWGVSHSIVSGTEKGIEPKGNATRAQIAVILQAYDKNVRK